MTYIEAAIAIIASTVITSFVEHFSGKLITSFTKYAPKKKRAALLVTLMAKYVILALVMIFFILKMDFDKTFVVSIVVLILICSFFIAKDVLLYSIRSFTFSIERDNIQKKIDMYLRGLAKCDPKDRTKQDEYIKKIQELTKEKDLYL
jgi:protein-S-isoprenylcysteine O-methyltransferase Ste14